MKHISNSLIISFFLIRFSAVAQWAPFGPDGLTNNTVVDFEYYNNELYATGLFTRINGVTARCVVKWNDSTWVQSGNPNILTDWGHSLKTIDTVMYLAKYRATNDSNFLWYYNGTDWKTLGRAFRLTGQSGPVTPFSLKPDLYDVIKYNNDIYVCGEFNRCGPDTIKGIARWNGTKWVKCGVGLDSAIAGGATNLYPHQMYVFNNKLHVVGNFKKAGGVICNGIAAWDGTSWTSLNSGFNRTVYAVNSYQGELYAGGEFTASATGTALGGIAKWNGTQWVDPGFRFYTINAQSGNFCFVHTLAEIQNKFYVLGGFNRVSTTTTMTCGSIVEYDGTSIDTLSGGADSDVEGITGFVTAAPSQTVILIGGIFKSVGSPVVACNNLAIYNRNGLAMGLNEWIADKEISIYPNPAKEQLIISGNNSSIQAIQVYDVTGKLVETRSVNNIQNVTLNTEEYKKGLYLVVISGSNKTMARKFVVE